MSKARPPLDPGAPPLNGELRRDPSLYPLDASWLDIHHDKGQLGRADAAWLGRLAEARLAAGEDPIELAVHAWLMCDRPGSGGGAGFRRALFARAPQAAFAFLGLLPEPTAEACDRLARVFEEASRGWDSPRSRALRGWSPAHTDTAVREGTRALYAHHAKALALAAAEGFLEPCSAAAERVERFEHVERFEGGARLGAGPDRALPIIASGAIHSVLPAAVDAMAAASAVDRERAMAAAARVVELCMRHKSPPNYRKAAAALFADPMERSRATARAARAFMLAIEGEPALVELHEGWRRRSLEIGGELRDIGARGDAAKRAELEASQRELSRRAMACAQWDREPLNRQARARGAAALGAAAAAEASPEALRAYAETLCGGELSSPEAHASAARLLGCAGGCSAGQAPTLAIALGKAFASAGSALELPEALRLELWSAHVRHASRANAASPQGYANRHRALAKLFPCSAGEAASIAMATPKVISILESEALRDALADWSPKTALAEAEAADEGAEEPAKPRARLRL